MVHDIVVVWHVLMVQNSIHRLLSDALPHICFPYDTTNSPLHKLTFLGQFVTAMYDRLHGGGFHTHTFIATLVPHTCGQFSNLWHELTNLHVCGISEEVDKYHEKAHIHICIFQQVRLTDFQRSIV